MSFPFIHHSNTIYELPLTLSLLTSAIIAIIIVSNILTYADKIDFKISRQHSKLNRNSFHKYSISNNKTKRILHKANFKERSY